MKQNIGGDCFVIMGAAVRKDLAPSGAMRRRVEGALVLGRTSAKPIYLVTGGVGKYGDAESQVMKRLLIQAGVSETSILVDAESRDTLASVIRCAKILKQHNNLSSITVCSDRYHIHRCRWLFYLLGIRTRFGEMPSGKTANGSLRWFFYYFRELVATPFDTVVLLVTRTFSQIA